MDPSLGIQISDFHISVNNSQIWSIYFVLKLLFIQVESIAIGISLIVNQMQAKYLQMDKFLVSANNPRISTK